MHLYNIVEEKHNIEYEGTTFYIDNIKYRSRLAKSTPVKKGYFVVFWKKNDLNKNQPYPYVESPDKIIISIIDNKYIDQFIFPKEILLEKNILSSSNTKGKMGIRVYPTWEKDLNNSAAKTQKWQSKYFLNLTEDIDVAKIRELYF